MALAGAFLFAGINIMGYKVMRTIGSSISFINMHRGFCMEFSSTITVVVATLLNFPVSTTHCQVGAVVFVSLAAVGREQVSLPMLGRIGLSWLITIPISAGVAALMTFFFKLIIQN